VAGGAGAFNIAGMTTTMLIEPDDSILLAGGFHSFQMAHYSADGVLDSSFGSGGYVNTGIAGGNAKATAIILDGSKILLAGTTQVSTISGIMGNFAVARYNANGTLDHTFGPRITGQVQYRGAWASRFDDPKQIAYSTCNNDQAGASS